MKTKYQKPNTKVIIVESQNLMIVSGEGSKNVSVSGSSYRGGAIYGRQGSAWDDDEE